MVYYCDSFIDDYLDAFSRTHRPSFGRGATALPRMNDIMTMEDELSELFFPGHIGTQDKNSLRKTVAYHMENATRLLFDSISLALRYESKDNPVSSDSCEEKAKEIVDALCRKLPEIRADLKKDAEAGFKGDPAARNTHEVILCYPAIRALTVHRVAHFLYRMGVPLIPRMMSEVIHSRTGIDIHPGASIGESFFIDHGTGVVIGETTVIGSNVKIYQGVTLGALSFPKDGCGLLLRDAKRHPTIEDNVTIYANATILGDITIGRNSTIASNAWIKEDIPENSRVFTPMPEIRIKKVLPQS